MRCPNCGRSRGVSQERDFDETVYHCNNCDSWFLVDSDGNSYLSSYDELCEIQNRIYDSYDEDDDEEDDDYDDDYEDDDSEFDSQRATYVWRGCAKCSKWNDWTGCRDMLEKGDWCNNPDFW